MSSSNLPSRDPELISAYIDGELSGEELRVAEAWLAEDPDARALADELRGVSATLQALPQQTPSADWSQQLGERLDEVAAPGERASFNVPLGRSSRGWLYSAAAIAAAVAIMFWVPREVDNQVAVNKPAANGGELREESLDDKPDRLELRGEAFASGDPETDTSTSDATTADAPLADAPVGEMEDALATREERASESADSSGEPELMAGAASGRASRTAPPVPTAAPLASREDRLAAEADGESATDNRFIVWADVPPDAIRNRRINVVLASNGIRLGGPSEPAGDTAAADSARVEATEDEATPPAAAEPMLEQIAVRNYVHNVESNSLGGGRASGGYGGGFGGGFGGGGRIATDNTARDRRDDADESAPAETAEPEARDGRTLEGETILVEATAEQIASCLVDMEQDATTYRTITLEPVQQFDQLQQLADKVDQEQLQELAKQDYGLWQFYQQQGIADRSQRGAKVASGADLQNRKGTTDEFPSQGTQTKQGFANQMAEQPVAQAQRLKRPEQWYYYNAPPQSEPYAYRLRAGEQQDLNLQSKSTRTRSKGEFQRGASEMKQQLAQLRVQQRQQPAAASEAATLADTLPDRTPLQVLFVLRSTDLASDESAPQP